MNPYHKELARLASRENRWTLIQWEGIIVAYMRVLMPDDCERTAIIVKRPKELMEKLMEMIR